MRLRKLLALALAPALMGQNPAPVPAEPEERPMFSVSSNLVVLNVAVKDSKGKPVEGLKPEDFVLTEDGKSQTLGVFEFQKLSFDPLPEFQDAPAAIPGSGPNANSFKNRRLLVLYFDFSGLGSQDEILAVRAGRTFVTQQMTSADLVAVYMYSNELQEVQPFTADRAVLLRAIDSVRTLRQATSDTGSDATDEAELEAFNTDRKLLALQDLARELGRIPEKKVVAYFSSGISSNGLENRSQLRATTNTANRANVSFYPIDARGLTASAPGGGGVGGGTGLFSGASVSSNRDGTLKQQDTLFALAADTGGKALLENNNLAAGIVQAQRAVESYYVLGYYGTERTDGAFRSIKISVKNRKDLKLEYRPGFYSSKDFKKFSAAEKDSQLEDALRSDYPSTDIPMAVEVNYFRLEKNRYFVPISVKVPGSAVTLIQKGAVGEAAFDFVGRVQNQRKQSATMRDTIKVKIAESQADKLAQRSLLYDVGVQLEPGSYTLKMLTRENQEGKMGTFETSFTVPNVDTQPASSLKLSSVVWSGQRDRLDAAVGAAGQSKKDAEVNPLVSNGQKIVPTVTRTIKAGGTLYVYCELYDAATSPSVSANITVLQGSRIVLESMGTRVTRHPANRPEAIPVQLQVPLDKLAPGAYTVQLNVVDEANQRFEFRRANITVTP